MHPPAGRTVDGRPQASTAWEDRLSSGLILLAVIGLFGTWLFTKVRRRMGLGMTSKHYLIAFSAIVLVILAIWANGHT